MAEFVIHVPDLDETGKHFDFPVRRAWLERVLNETEVEMPAGAPEGVVSVDVSKQGKDVLVRGRVTASLVAECSRCLEDAKIDVDSDLTTLLIARSADVRPPPDELELTPEDLDREFFTGDQIVLDDIVREHVLLEVPIQPLCSPDCSGIPVPAEIAGPADLASAVKQGGVDPRFAPLLKLVGKLDPTKE